MSELRGRYPGGPSRKKPEGEETTPRRNVRLDSVETIEARAAAGAQVRRRKRRKRRIAVGVAVSIALAGAIGGWLGFQSHRTDQEIAEGIRGQARGMEFDLNQQADRLINEIWKTEALEKMPGRRGP